MAVLAGCVFGFPPVGSATAHSAAPIDRARTGGSGPAPAEAEPAAARSGIARASVSFRIGPARWLSEARLRELLDLLDKYRGVTDELTFFSSDTHAPLPLGVFERRMAVIAARMTLARSRGYRAGINILATIGHHEENLENSLRGDDTHVTDIDGRVSRGSLCPNDENVRGYVREIYRAAAEANPDYIWIDDDVRLAGHMPVYLTCFCDKCLDIFAKETGVRYTRESFKKAVNEGPLEEKLRVRKAWLEHNRRTIGRLFELIESTVHEARPGLTLGFMTGDRFYEGYDFASWAKILAGPASAPVMWRPGGGFYEDTNTAELAGKAHDIGRQVAALPADVRVIESEIENFPYQRLKKAADVNVLEAASDVAAGATGAAFNVLSFYDEPLDEFEPLVASLARARPFLDLLVSTLGRGKPSGIDTFWNRDSFAAANLARGSWFEPAAVLPAHEVYDIGLPAGYADGASGCASGGVLGRGAAPAFIVGREAVDAASKEELQTILSRGVYLDGAALGRLNELGYGELTGFVVIRADKADRIEELSAHPLNGGFAGRLRDGRQSFLAWARPAYVLKPTAPGAQVLSGLIDYTGRNVAACAMGVFENRLGGRVCAAGYYPFTFLENLSKSAQIKAIFRWLSKDSLPAYVASFHKVNLWARETDAGRVAAALTNSTFDSAENLVIMVRTKATTASLYDMSCGRTILRSTATDGPYQKFVIPAVPPWQMRLLIGDTIPIH